MVREPIYQALIGVLQQLQTGSYAQQFPNLVVSRGFVMWDEADVQPAIYLVPKTETAEYRRGLPTKWKMTMDLYIYVRADSISLGVQNLSLLMDAIDAVLSPLGANAGSPNDFVETLGGLVVYCAIQGATDISGGFLNGLQTVARMSLEVIVA